MSDKQVVKVIGGTDRRKWERSCEVLFKDHKIIILRPVPDKDNELFIFYATRGSNGFNVVLPGESIRVNLCEVGIPKASGQYKLAVDGSVSIEIDPVVYAATYIATKKAVKGKRKKLLGRVGRKR